MKKALISPNEIVYSYGGVPLGERVAEVSTVPFEVALPLFWVDCSDDAVADQWYYDTSSSQVIQFPAPPVITASFNPNPTLVNFGTNLTWNVTNATGVKLSSYGDQIFEPSGSMSFTYPNAGAYLETVVALNPNGDTARSVTIRVVATQAEVDAGGVAPFTVI